MIVLTVIGAMAAHCFARYTFRANRLVLFHDLLAIIFPPQLTILALFQILVHTSVQQPDRADLVYVATQLP